MHRTGLIIAYTWDGDPLPPGDCASVALNLGPEVLEVAVEAPFHGDPPPAEPPGPVEGLWEFEVVEVFLLGAEDCYLEIELGPFGHHLVLRLQGRRQVEATRLPLAYTATRRGARWSGVARVPISHLPERLRAWNAYAIHGVGRKRRYLAAHPVGGQEPDFHRLEAFGRLEWLQEAGEEAAECGRMANRRSGH